MFWLGMLIGFVVGAIVSCITTAYLLVLSADDWETFMAEEQDAYVRKIMKQS